MATERVGDLTLDELRIFLREELKSLIHEAVQDALATEGKRPARLELPVLDLGPWPENFVEEREGREED